MNLNYLDFEQPIAELQKRIDELRFVANGSEVNIADQIHQLEAKSRELTEQIFTHLTAWQIAQLARHPQRPYALDYIKAIFTEWEELHGDRAYRDDPAIVCGVARLDGRPVVVIGQQKGRDARERVFRNFGMPKPEGYRKALRIMRLAEKFHLPVVTLIDTPGAYPGIGAEERNQSEAIARNLFELSRLRTPVLATVIGEGGSGGALAIGVADHLMMLQYSIYSVISPEGCASILFKDATHAPRAAEMSRLTANELVKLRIADEVVPEPEGGAHTDIGATSLAVREAVARNLDELCGTPGPELIARRYDRFRAFGEFVLQSEARSTAA